MKLTLIFMAFAFAFFLPATAFAAPFKAANNPNIVANYDSGDHGIPGESATHTGADVVLQAGKSGNFIQWFVGTSTEADGFHGDHSVWLSVPDGTTAANQGVIVPTSQTDPNQFWGDYLTGTYLVKTNDFLNGQNQ